MVQGYAILLILSPLASFLKPFSITTKYSPFQTYQYTFHARNLVLRRLRQSHPRILTQTLSHQNPSFRNFPSTTSSTRE